MPWSTYIHKSMLLRGVQFGPPALNRGDIEVIKGRATRSGRSYGGAPLRGDHGNGRGRGGRINYADPRPNPFAAHINPNFSSLGNPNNAGGGRPQPPTGSWGLPPAGTEPSWRGPPPPPLYGFPASGQGASYGGQPPPHLPPNKNYGGSHRGKRHSGNQFSNHQGYSAPPPDGRFGGQGR